MSALDERLEAARASLGPGLTEEQDEAAIGEIVALQHLDGLLKRHPAGHVTEGLRLLAALLDTGLGPREIRRRFTAWAAEAVGEQLLLSRELSVIERELMAVAQAVREEL